MQITWFVLFYMIQAWTKEYWEKNKKTLSDWLVHLGQNLKAKHRLSPTLPLIDTEQKEHIWHSCK